MDTMATMAIMGIMENQENMDIMKAKRGKDVMVKDVKEGNVSQEKMIRRMNIDITIIMGIMGIRDIMDIMMVNQKKKENALKNKLKNVRKI